MNKILYTVKSPDWERTYHSWLMLGDEEVLNDYMEPEDCTLGRDLGKFVAQLNQERQARINLVNEVESVLRLYGDMLPDSAIERLNVVLDADVLI